MKLFGIILLASERSGSNLLRTLLGNHSDISSPIAPHLIKIFYPIKHYYLDLSSKVNNKNLFCDMLQIVNHPFSNWKLELEYNYNEIESLEIYSVVRMMDYFYKKKSERNKKEYYCSKGINTFRFIDQIRKEDPTLKFLHLVRDPRDVVASWMKQKSSSNSSYDAVLQWKKQQKLLIDAKKNSKFSCIAIRYEDLISDTSTSMDKIILELGLPPDEKCYVTNPLNKESIKSPFWKNLSQPIMVKNRNKFMEELSEEDILIVETIAKDEMKEYGYSPVSSQNWKLSRESINCINRQKQIRKEQAKNNINDHMQSVISREQLIKKIIDKRRIKYLSSISYMERVKNYIKLDMYKLIKRYFLQSLGNYRIIFIIRNYINK
jgi:hypothetical protein